MTSTKVRSGRLALVSMFALLWLSACGDDGLPSRTPVSGTVKYNGQPLAKGTINFYPDDAEKGRPASGAIEDGAYRLTTLTPDDGAIPGGYSVTISATDVDLSKVPGSTGGGMPDQTGVAKASAKAKKLIPDKYNSPMTSGLKSKVPDGPYDFDLKD